VGSLKPNDFGLFAMYGNVLNWCQDRAMFYSQGEAGKAADDIEGDLSIMNQESRSLRCEGVWRSCMRYSQKDSPLSGQQLPLPATVSRLQAFFR
jgi:formylglycine-generating enzyme required for sulfatase activity